MTYQFDYGSVSTQHPRCTIRDCFFDSPVIERDFYQSAEWIFVVPFTGGAVGI